MQEKSSDGINELLVFEEELEGVRLIEASAGTGKTFSLSMLVLRVILEKYQKEDYKNVLKDILIVTFTNAATEEMRLRISKFIDMALEFYENGDDVEAEDWKKEFFNYLKKIIVVNGKVDENKKNDKIRLLKLAEINLNEASIYTIHSFSQRMLMEFSVKTGFVNNFSIIPDESNLIEYCVRKFWRERVNIKKSDYKDLVDLRNNNLYKIMISSVNKHLSGKKLNTADVDNNKKILTLLDELNKFVDKELEQIKRQENLLSFNDIVVLLHRKVNEDKHLSKLISKKYRAVFVDEFQDTDKYQYEIFKKVFVDNKVTTFFVGDPKQAIYSFRGADINVYYRARKEIGNNKNIRKLLTNYRSEKELIKDINDFFKNLNKKLFQKGLNNRIKFEYEEVKSYKKSNNQEEKTKNNESRRLIVYESWDKKVKKDDIKEKISILISRILKDKKYKESDIAILVRSKGDGKSIKEVLDKAGINSVFEQDTKVITTQEAKFIYYVLRAALFTTETNVRTVLYDDRIIKFDLDRLLNENKEEEYEKFSRIKQTWEQEGIFPAVMTIMKEFNIFANIFENIDLEKKQIITNILHVAEILNQKEINSNLTPIKFLDWFGKEIEKPNEALNYELRIEGDTEKIRILTIHKSKGLEFPVVIIPFLNFYICSADKLYDFFDENLNEWRYNYSEKSFCKEEKYLNNAISEALRLMYVAITRAKDYTYLVINKMDKRYFINSLLKYIDEKEEDPKSVFNYEAKSIEEIKDVVVQDKEKESGTNKEEINNKTVNIMEFKGDISLNWQVTSYSELDEHQVITEVEECEKELEGYDDFIFNKLPRGAGAGNVIHNLLEEIDFKEDFDKYEVPEKYVRFVGDKKCEEYFRQLLKNVGFAEYKDDNNNVFSLNKTYNVFKEEEFYFSFDDFAKERLEKIIGDLKISGNEFTKAGVVHGFIDLIFEYNNKIYILDWKSNFLGCNLEEDYGNKQLEKAIQDYNYKLQYYIYSTALFRYLGEKEFKNKFGGVFYVFIRGARQGKSYGIYKTVPDINKIKIISEQVFKV